MINNIFLKRPRTVCLAILSSIVASSVAILAEPAVKAGAAESTRVIPNEIAPIKAPFRMPDLQRPEFPDRVFDIRDFGAKPGGANKSTAAIAAAIKACHEAGGGRVLIPAGEWLTGPIHLKSHVNLHIAEGAVVHFSRDLEDYLPVVIVRHEGVEAYNQSR